MTSTSDLRPQKSRRFLLLLTVALCSLRSEVCHAQDTPPRLFFSDAKISVTVPEPWEVPSSFPYGPLLTRKTPEGSEAFVLCQISDPVATTQLSVDKSTDVLSAFAAQDLQTRPDHPRALARSSRLLNGHNAFEVTWLTEGAEGAVQYQSVYFFLDNRYYVLSLRAQRDSFPWIVQEFQTWLGDVQLLSRRASGTLDAPSHGGLWVHQTGGLKVAFPDAWLIALADDRQVGATVAVQRMHLDFSAVADVSMPAKPLTLAEKADARRTLKEKGFTILTETDDPFHGYPAYQLAYEGGVEDRFVRGQDVWVASPKARWLISLEGDSKLLRQRAEEWQGILNGMQFRE